MAETIAFYICAGGAIITSALVIAQSNPMHSVLLLVASFAMISGLYVQLDAPFIAVTQIIVYAGALMVLFVFVVMLLNASNESASEWDRVHPMRHPLIARFGVGLAVVLVLQLVWALLRTSDARARIGGGTEDVAVSSVRVLGRVLFRDYMFAFEATSVLILVALIGGVFLAHGEGDR